MPHNWGEPFCASFPSTLHREVEMNGSEWCKREARLNIAMVSNGKQIITILEFIDIISDKL
jgi:hypothetical protein